MRNSLSTPVLCSRLAALAALLVFTAAACGGDDDDSAATATGDAAAVDSSDEDGASEDPSDDDTDGGGDDTETPADDGGGAAAGASVTIDGVTYEATEEQACTALGGGLGAVFTDVDGSVTISITLLPDGDPEPSTARVDDDSDEADTIQWESGGETVDLSDHADTAVVGDYTVDGRSGSGSATFIDTTAIMDGTATPVEGTFELRCAEA